MALPKLKNNTWKLTAAECNCDNKLYLLMYSYVIAMLNIMQSKSLVL